MTRKLSQIIWNVASHLGYGHKKTHIPSEFAMCQQRSEDKTMKSTVSYWSKTEEVWRKELFLRDSTHNHWVSTSIWNNTKWLLSVHHIISTLTLAVIMWCWAVCSVTFNFSIIFNPLVVKLGCLLQTFADHAFDFFRWNWGHDILHQDLQSTLQREYASCSHYITVVVVLDF